MFQEHTHPCWPTVQWLHQTAVRAPICYTLELFVHLVQLSVQWQTNVLHPILSILFIFLEELKSI